MSLVIPDGFAHVAMSFSTPSAAGPAIVTFGLGEGTATSPDDFIDSAHQAWIATGSLQDVMHEDIVLSNIYALWNDGGALRSDEAGFNIPGALDSGSPASPQVTVLIKKGTGFAGRSQRGRNYWPGVREADVDPDGGLLSSLFALWTDAAAVFLSSLASGAGGTTSMVLLHDSSSPTSGATEVTSYRVDPLVATQRRRLR